MQDLRSALAGLHKIDLHRHLEGSVRPATVAEICRTHHVELPTYDADDLTAMLCFTKPTDSLTSFLLPFKLIDSAFVNKEAVARVTFEAAEDAWLDNVHYVELRFSPECMAFRHGLKVADVMDGIVRGTELAMRTMPITAKLIVSISRDQSPQTMGMSWPSPVELALLAVDYADRGVVGLDLSGIEDGYPAAQFIEPFRIVRSAGLGITVHAGEDSGPESIREAIEDLGATRIGHGVRIVRDPDLLKIARDSGITLEICPTSNVLTHAVESLERHPIRELFDAGVRLTVNTDDPTVCGVTLTDEYALIAEKFGFTLDEIGALIENARRAAFHDVEIPSTKLQTPNKPQ